MPALAEVLVELVEVGLEVRAGGTRGIEVARVTGLGIPYADLEGGAALDDPVRQHLPHDDVRNQAADLELTGPVALARFLIHASNCARCLGSRRLVRGQPRERPPAMVTSSVARVSGRRSPSRPLSSCWSVRLRAGAVRSSC